MRRHIQFAETGNVGFQLVGIDRHIIIGLFALASRLHAGHHGSVKRLQIGFTLKVICQRHRIFGRDIQPVVTRQKRQEKQKQIYLFHLVGILKINGQSYGKLTGQRIGSKVVHTVGRVYQLRVDTGIIGQQEEVFGRHEETRTTDADFPDNLLF